MRWMDGVQKDMRNLGVVYWRAKAHERDGWRAGQGPQRVVVPIIIIWHNLLLILQKIFSDNVCTNEDTRH
jgi:hypothetical protein